MYNVQEYRILHNSVTQRVICDSWHFTQMWKTLDHFMKREKLVRALTTDLTPPHFLFGD